MKVFIQSIVAQVLFTPYIWYRGYQALPPSKGWRIPYTLLFILELALYFFGFIFRKELPDQVMDTIQYICNTWYIASIYLVLALLVLELLRLSNKLFRWYPPFIRKHYRQVKQALLVLFPCGAALLLVNAYHRVVNPIIKEVYITVPKDGGNLDSLTIVMISDMHIGEVIGRKLVEKYVDMSNRQRPDLVVFTGDMIDYDVRYAEKGNIAEVLRGLKAPLGVYAVYGNHEYRANRFAKDRWFEKAGMTLLKDSVVMPDSAFYLVGRDDRINKGRQALHTLLKGKDLSKPVIVLDHQPYSFAETAMNGADIGLSGHTHNGQLWPYPLVMKWIYECPYGEYQKGNTRFYVSSGLGVAGPPYRVGTVSEMVVLHIRFEPEQALSGQNFQSIQPN